MSPLGPHSDGNDGHRHRESAFGKEMRYLAQLDAHMVCMDMEHLLPRTTDANNLSALVWRIITWQG